MLQLRPVFLAIFLCALSALHCRPGSPSSHSPVVTTHPVVNPFPNSKWTSLESDGDSLRMEFTEETMRTLKRRNGGPCWADRGGSAYHVDGNTLTGLINGVLSSHEFEYFGGVLVFLSVQGDGRVWRQVEDFPTPTPGCI
jgi:hypothetical protein